MHFLKRKERLLSDIDSDSSDNSSKLFKKIRTNYTREVYSDVYSRGNHIIFKGDVNRNNVYKLREEIEKLNKDFKILKKNLEDGVFITPKPIYLHINSYGGYLDDGFAAVDFIKQSDIPIHTVVEGRCASAATLMSVVGVKRYMSEHSRLLIHQLRGGMWGKMADMEEVIEECRDAMNDIIGIYLEHTNMTEKQIRDQLKKEKFWSYKDCKKRGIVDEEWNG